MTTISSSISENDKAAFLETLKGLRIMKGKLLGNPMHIVMVNGEYEGTDTLEGRVIHDIMTTDP